MTIAKAERITGYKLIILPEPEFHLTLVVSDQDDKLIASKKIRRRPKMMAGQQIPIILEDFVKHNYRVNSLIVFANQNHRCAKCGAMKPLQAHHKKHRSQGRDDRVTNLTGLCKDCHESEHRS